MPMHNSAYVSNEEENVIFLISLHNHYEFYVYINIASQFRSGFNFLLH
jgi:hypothetical protein